MKFGIMGMNWIMDFFIEGVINLGEWNFIVVYLCIEEKVCVFGEKYGDLIYFMDIEEMGKLDVFDVVYIVFFNVFYY